MPAMAKKKKTGLYADIDDELKRRLVRMADYHDRKIAAELSVALRRYLEAEEKKANLPPVDPGEDD